MFVRTLRTATALRPGARWGFYGTPAGSSVLTSDTYPRAMADARSLQPVWAASGALYPSVYLNGQAGTLPERRYQVTAAVEISKAASRLVQPAPPVYPFAWECSSQGNGAALLSLADLRTELLLPYQNAGSDGLVVWGYSGGAEGGPTASSGSQRAAYYRHLRDVTGPMLWDFRAAVVVCSRVHCSSSGRCASVPPPSGGVACECFSGFAGKNCSHVTD